MGCSVDEEERKLAELGGRGDLNEVTRHSSPLVTRCASNRCSSLPGRISTPHSWRLAPKLRLGAETLMFLLTCYILSLK